jgi:hypothetical protein
MSSATPARDVSTTWPVHDCGHRHAPGGDCPETGQWLIEDAPATRRDVAVHPRRTAAK